MSTQLSESTSTSRATWYAFAVAFVAAVGGFLFGYDLAIVSGVLPHLRDKYGLSPAALGFAAGSAGLGCIIGPFLGAWMCDALGRTRTMMVACIMLGLGSLITAIPDHPTVVTLMGGMSVMTIYNLFRIVGGLGVGLCSVASPMYISETAPPRMRGGLGTMYQLAIVIGSVAAPFASYLIVNVVHDADHQWRWMFASEVVPVVGFVILLALLPQSPRWLAAKGRDAEALRVLESVDGPAFAREEMAAIRQSLAEEPARFSELFGRGMRYALLIGLLLAVFNNWSGWSVIGGYIPILLEKSGLRERSQQLLQFTISYGFMGVVTLLSCYMVDRVGRRPLWLVASALMAVIMFVSGLVFHLHLSGLIVLLVIMLCTIPHGIGLGPLPWLMISEIFPTRLRARAVSLTTSFLWLTIFGCAQLFPIITDASEKTIGSAAGAFWLCSAICVLSFIFGLKMLPETKGRTLEEISASWTKNRDGNAA